MGIYGDLVRVLTESNPVESGDGTLVWDGKDEDGAMVPDEAYVPVLTAVTKDGRKTTRDPRSDSGGELVDDVRVEITPSKDISYYLPVPSRVLIRAGIKGGAMLRSLASWESRGAGKNVQRWDGRDQNGLMDIRGEKNLGILVIAFKLPLHWIIAVGNRAINYRDYRQAKGWEEVMVPPEAMVLERDGKSISPHYYFPRSLDPVPKVTLSLPDKVSKSAAGLPIVKPGEAVAVRADIVKDDRWLMKRACTKSHFSSIINSPRKKSRAMCR